MPHRSISLQRARNQLRSRGARGGQARHEEPENRRPSGDGGLPLCARGRREEEDAEEERERRASRSARRAPAGSRMAVAAD